MKPSNNQFIEAKNQAIKEARGFFQNSRSVILDTETTGLGPKAEVIQISIINSSGQTLFNSLVDPERKTIPKDASAIHGLTKKALIGSPDWITVQRQIEPILKRATVYTYNSDFDERLIVQTSQRYSMRVMDLDFVCIMKMYSRFRGDWDESRGDYKWHKLNGDHSALGDCLAALERLKEMASAEPVALIESKPELPKSSVATNWQQEILERNEKETQEYLKSTPSLKPTYPVMAILLICISVIFIGLVLLASCHAR